MEPSKNAILKTSSLTYPDLKKLLNNEVMAISIENFTSVDVCKEVADKILNNQKYKYYDYAQNVVGRYGMSFSEGVSEAKRNEYYSQSLPTVTEIRSFFSPYLAPLDQLRLRLDEICPSGAKLEQIEENKTMFVGLCRVIDPDKIVLPHQDDIRWDHDLDIVANLISQLAVNIYLKVPEVGGELELWDYGFETKEEYLRQADGSYGIAKVKLLSPVVQMTPKVGELIIFNPRNLHCILPGNESRMSQSCFLGYRGDNSPITYWS